MPPRPPVGPPPSAGTPPEGSLRPLPPAPPAPDPDAALRAALAGQRPAAETDPGLAWGATPATDPGGPPQPTSPDEVSPAWQETSPTDPNAALRAALAALRAQSDNATLDGSLDALSDSGAAATTSPPSLTPTASAPGAAPPTPPHLRVSGLLGRGGMGEVWLAEDLRLGCAVALKVIHARLAAHPNLVERFLREARLTARLQHPGVVPIHELSALPDGRPYYTMLRVQGRPLSADLRRGPHDEPGPWLRARAQLLLRVAEAVGFAHSQGVVHRDLKPDNVCVGAHGEVLVLDWGLAADTGALLGAGEAAARQLTRGAVGTLGFMPPEQLRGEPPAPRFDVFALGRMIEDTLAEAQPLPAGAGGLVELAARCVDLDPARRPPTAAPVAAELQRWLDGARRRVDALALVAEADREAEAAARDRAAAAALRAGAAEAAARLSPTAPEAEKAPVWAQQDEAERLVRAAGTAELRRVQALRAALTHAADLPEARARLAQRFRAQHAEAEARGDEAAAEAWALELAAVDDGDHADYLRGDGAFCLRCAVPTRVELWADVREGRRSRLRFVEDLGWTPIIERRLPRGSYRLRLCAEGHAEVWHPLLIRRLQHEAWRGPPLRLPRLGELGPEDHLVTPGWTLIGGDPGAANAAPTARVWVEGVVMRRYPVRNREHLAVLNALLDAGLEDEALAAAPRERPGPGGALGRLLLERDPSPPGHLRLGVDAEGHAWLPEHPALMVDLAGAEAHAAWVAAREGLPWRLPDELEWERAARGADGRTFPWGEQLDPTWAWHRNSHPEGAEIGPKPVGAAPVDEGPFGVADLAGGCREWTRNRWGADVPQLAQLPTLRGGGWNNHPQLCRAATRGWSDPRDRSQSVGFRLCRSWDSGG